MDNGIKRIENVIDYIEENLTGVLDFDKILSMVNVSLYEFRRLFSFIVGCPISEYIRKRRLSLAALDILNDEHPDILKISEKYGYANQSSFTRAFSEYHGIAPTACVNKDVQIKLFTRPKFEITVVGRENVPLKVIKTDRFFIQGFKGISPLTDTCCCDDVWEAYLESSLSENVPGDHLYVSYSSRGDLVHCCIGTMADEGEEIPASRWACFKMNTVDDETVNREYGKILCDILPSANIKRNEQIPTVEVFPSDMSQEGFEWEIWIPIL